MMKPASRIGQAALRQAVRSPIRAHTSANCVMLRAAVAQGRSTYPVSSPRSFHFSSRAQGLMPDSENPAPRKSEEVDKPTVPTDISTSEFHQRADETLDDLVARLEEKQEETPDVEVEYSVGKYHCIVTGMTANTFIAGWRAGSQSCLQRAYLRAQQTTSQQADMAQLAYLWT